jgi:transposase
MRFYTQQHPYYCGVDLHTKMMYLCIMSHDGEIVLHRNLKTDPKAFLAAIAPYRDGLVVGVECVFCWYWLADLCARESISFVLGHALYMKAIHGGKAKNDKVDSHKIAGLLRGGMFPQAYVYPAEMRATRDLLRRRQYLVQRRAELLAHIQNTNSQYNLPALDKKLDRKANRVDVPKHFSDVAVRKSIEVDLALLDELDVLIKRLEAHIVREVRVHDPRSWWRLRSVPGIGEVLGLVMLYEIHDIERFAGAQNFCSYGRLVKCAKQSAGKHYGYSGNKIGNAHLKWAFSEAVCLMMRELPQAKAFVDTRAKKHGKGKAMSILTHKLGRAVYYMLKRKEAFDVKYFFAQ